MFIPIYKHFLAGPNTIANGLLSTKIYQNTFYNFSMSEQNIQKKLDDVRGKLVARKK